MVIIRSMVVHHNNLWDTQGKDRGWYMVVGAGEGIRGAEVHRVLHVVLQRREGRSRWLVDGELP